MLAEIKEEIMDQSELNDDKLQANLKTGSTKEEKSPVYQVEQSDLSNIFSDPNKDQSNLSLL